MAAVSLVIETILQLEKFVTGFSCDINLLVNASVLK